MLLLLKARARKVWESISCANICYADVVVTSCGVTAHTVIHFCTVFNQFSPDAKIFTMLILCVPFPPAVSSHKLQPVGMGCPHFTLILPYDIKRCLYFKKQRKFKSINCISVASFTRVSVANLRLCEHRCAKYVLTPVLIQNHILYHCPNKTGQSQMLRFCEETDRKWWVSAGELKGPPPAAAYHVCCAIHSKVN